MELLFGRPKTQAEIFGESRATIRRAVREAERNKDRSEDAEKYTISEIRQKAKKGVTKQALRTLAKKLVRQRNQTKRFDRVATQLEGLCDKINEMKSVEAMNKTMTSVARTMKMLNGTMNIAQVARTAQSIERSSEMLDSKMETFDETIDSILSGDDDEKETEEVVDKVLDEILISISGQMKTAPRVAPVHAAAAKQATTPTQQQHQKLPVTEETSDDALALRLAKLTSHATDDEP